MTIGLNLSICPITSIGPGMKAIQIIVLFLLNLIPVFRSVWCVNIQIFKQERIFGLFCTAKNHIVSDCSSSLCSLKSSFHIACVPDLLLLEFRIFYQDTICVLIGTGQYHGNRRAS